MKRRLFFNISVYVALFAAKRKGFSALINIRGHLCETFRGDEYFGVVEVKRWIARP